MRLEKRGDGSVCCGLCECLVGVNVVGFISDVLMVIAVRERFVGWYFVCFCGDGLILRRIGR